MNVQNICFAGQNTEITAESLKGSVALDFFFYFPPTTPKGTIWQM